MRNTDDQNSLALVTTPQEIGKTIRTHSPLITQFLTTLDDLQTVQRQLQYFTREIKLWSSPQKKLK